jgi:putative addiction module component (TIGR02574 family)
MAVRVEKLTEEVLALPADARALLADRLVESLDPLTDDAVRGSWAAEAGRRRDEIRSGKVAAIPGEAAAEQVRALLRK